MVKIKIFLDAGHGSKDSGAFNKELNQKESDLNLLITLYQKKRFEEHGFIVKTTRTDDTFVELNDRISLAKNSGAKLSISNHINDDARPDKSTHGLEVIRSLNYNTGLAEKIVKEINNINWKTRNIKTRESENYPGRDYYAMNRTGIEGIIIEYGFIGTEDDISELLIRWEELAEAVVKAVVEYLGIKYLPLKGSDILSQFKDASDIPEWAENEIRYMVENGLMEGNEQGYFLPNKGMTRAEVSKFIYNVLKNFKIIE